MNCSGIFRAAQYHTRQLGECSQWRAVPAYYAENLIHLAFENDSNDISHSIGYYTCGGHIGQNRLGQQTLAIV